MTAVSFGVQRGFATRLLSGSVAGTPVITVGTNAPSGSFDIEFRWNQTDQNSHNLTRKDLVLALELFIRAIEQGGSNIDVTTGVIGPPG